MGGNTGKGLKEIVATSAVPLYGPVPDLCFEDCAGFIASSPKDVDGNWKQFRSGPLV